MGWIIGLPEDKLARWFYFYNHDPIGWFSTPTWWLWKSVFGCKKPTRAFGGWFFTPAWWLEISALFHHGFKKQPRAQGCSFFQFSLVRKMGIFLNCLVKPFWKYIHIFWTFKIYIDKLDRQFLNLWRAKLARRSLMSCVQTCNE